MTCLHVIRPGLLTTVQDLGRWGLQSRGVPVAGPMDPRSHRIANALVGNDPAAAALEITMVGPDVEFEDPRLVAVSGAVFDLSVDGSLVPMNSPFLASARSRVKFGARTHGARAYLAVSGGIAVPSVFGSRSTHLASRMGGLDGRALVKGDRLPLGTLSTMSTIHLAASVTARTPDALLQIHLPRGHAHVRVLPGPERERFREDALDVLCSAPYTIEANSDRMAFRLRGPAIRHADGADIISDATPLGVLQVPASGQPMLLMADRQTTGGYPKLATLITADIPIAAQLAPGETISFEICSPLAAMAALIADERVLMAIEAKP